MSQKSPVARGAIRIRVAEISLDETSRAVRRGPGRGLRQAQRVIDAETRRLPAEDRGPVACEAGCDFCCHLRVMATAPEVFALLDYLRETLDASAYDAFVDRAQTTDSTLRKLSSDEILRTNLACPALVDGRCSGYAARPLNCRSYHSLSREACETSFHNPEDLDRGHPEIRPLAEVHQGGQAGYTASLERAGYDARQYELASALAEALRDPEARERLERGQPVFASPLGVPDP
jgi:Fe-S-cluster containining protein